jgi:hypothetical protein
MTRRGHLGRDLHRPRGVGAEVEVDVAFVLEHTPHRLADERLIVAAEDQAGLVELRLSDAVNPPADHGARQRLALDPALDLEVDPGVERRAPEQGEHVGRRRAPEIVGRGPGQEDDLRGQVPLRMPELARRDDGEERVVAEDVAARVRDLEPEAWEAPVVLDHPPEQARIGEDRGGVGLAQALLDGREVHASLGGHEQDAGDCGSHPARIPPRGGASWSPARIRRIWRAPFGVQ